MVVFAKRYYRYSGINTYNRGINERSLLWPVYVYRITYPDFANRPLNLFQEGILGLFRAGCKRSEEIARLLDLDTDLVAFIIETQLKPNGWVDNQEITDKGSMVLDGKEWRKGFLIESESDTVKLKMGYAFWDTIGQQWIPRMSARLPEVEPIGYKSQFPEFSRERQKGGKIRPYCLTPGDSAKPKIVAEELLNAYRTYRLDVHHAKQLGMPPEREEQIALQSIDVVSDEPEPGYLWVSLARDEDYLERWSVSDPFHIRTKASWLRKPIDAHINNEPGLARQLDQVLGKADSDSQNAKQWLQAMDDEVKMVLLAEYQYLGNYKTITRYLQSVLHLQLKIDEGDDNAGQKDALLTELQKLIESVLKWMLDRWTVNLQRLPSSRKSPTPEQMKGIFNGLQLLNIPESCFDQLSIQSWKNIHGSLRWKSNVRGGSAKAYLCGVILSTTENEDHPFRLHSEAELNISKLLEVFDMRNAAGHASGQEFSKEVVLDFSQFTLKWVQSFKEYF